MRIELRIERRENPNVDLVKNFGSNENQESRL